MQRRIQDEIAFGPFRISRSERLLRKGEEAVPLPPKAIDTLLSLTEAAGRVVAKKDLLERVWPDTFVEEGGLTRNISVLRKALGADDTGKPFIETIPRRGYRFVARVTEGAVANPGAWTLEGKPEKQAAGEVSSECLRGRHFWSQRTNAGLEQALACFRLAIERNPEDAAAHAGLAETYALLGSIGYDGMPPHAAMPNARQAALEALRLQPELAEGHSALGIVKLLYDWDFAGAEASLTCALRFDPACLAAYQWQGELELAMARPERAGAAFACGTEIDPFSVPCQLGLGWSYYFSRRYEHAIRQFRSTLELAPGLPMALYGLGLSFHHQGDFGQALEVVHEAEASSGGEPASVMLLAATASLLGHAEASSEQLRRLREMLPRRYVPPVYFAFVHAMRNELDDAFDWLERAFDERSSYLIFLRLQPALHNLRSDPRYFALVRRVGI